MREFQYSTVALPVPEAFMDAAIANSRRMPARCGSGCCRGCSTSQPWPARPRVRTLVLGGSRDAVFSVAEQTDVAGISVWRLHLIEGVGHALHWEQPEMFVSALLRFGL